MGEPRIRPDKDVIATATGSAASQAQSLDSHSSVWFHGLSGLVRIATVYAPMA